MLAYLFERFPKFSQTFCYREVAELFRQGERPLIFSLRAPQLGPEQTWDREILSAVEVLPEGDALAAEADAAAKKLDRAGRRTLRSWRGRDDSLRLHQAAVVGARLRAQGATHLHTHFAGMAARTAYWIKEFFAMPWSMTVHANDIFAPLSYEIGLPKLTASARTVIAVSDFAADFLRQKFPAAKITRVYNGIDLAAFSATRFEAPPLLLSIGRFIQKKGFDIFIESCRILRERGLQFRAGIIGDGPLREELEEAAAKARVSLAGEKSQPQIRAALARATAFVLPARIDENGAMDNLPTVIMEAMAASLPVVATTVAGIPEMVVPGETGILVPPDHPVALADALERLLRDQPLARAMGQRGHARAADRFQLAKNVRELRQAMR